MTFIQDNRNISTLTPDQRAVGGLKHKPIGLLLTLLKAVFVSAGSVLTQNTKTSGPYLWTNSVYPWAATSEPWMITGGFSILTQDKRH